jgi:hypothetical protein
LVFYQSSVVNDVLLGVTQRHTLKLRHNELRVVVLEHLTDGRCT